MLSRTWRLPTSANTTTSRQPGKSDDTTRKGTNSETYNLNQVFYALAHVAMTYLIAWLMNGNGPVGQHVHAWAGSLVPK